MLHSSCHALRLFACGLAIGGLSVALMPGCRSGEISPQKESSAPPAAATPATPPATTPPATTPPATIPPAAPSAAAPSPAPSPAAAPGAAGQAAHGEAALPAVPQVNVEAKDQGLIITDKDGKEAIRLDTTSGKPPEDWPNEVPLYPGGKVQMSMKLGRGSTLTLETADPVAKVIEYYKTQLARMPQTNAVDSGDSHTVMWSDPSKPLQVTLALTAAEGKTRATLIVTRERAR